MSRSLKKGPYVDPKLLMKVMKAKSADDRKPIKTWARESTVHPDFVTMKFSVHNGNKFIEVFVTEDMVGHKLGEFAASRTFRGHTGVKATETPAEAPKS